MGFDLSIRQVVLILLSISAFILGLILLITVSFFNYKVPFYGFGDMKVEVFPDNSNAGTLFLVNAFYKNDKETQDLDLTIDNNNKTYDLQLFDDGLHYDKKAKDGIYGGFFDSNNKPLGVYQIKNEDKDLASFSISKSGCEIIEGNPKPDSIDILILPSGYGQGDYNEFKEDSKKILLSENSILTKEPYLSNKDKLVFTIINSTKDFKCSVGCKNVPTLICCDDKTIYDEASKCHYDSFIVLLKNDGYCGSAASYAKICAKNPGSSIFLMHEFGHSFADLADEYVYSDFFNYTIEDSEKENCAKEGCTKWNGMNVGCFKGCTYSNMYRPVEKNSVMLDLYPEYDLVSQEQINTTINDYTKKENNFDLLLPIKKSYYTDFKYNSGKLIINKITIKPVQPSINVKKSSYSYKIFGKSNKKLFENMIDVPNEEDTLPGDSIGGNSSNGIILDDNFEFSSLIPYFNNGENLVIYKNGKAITNVSLISFNSKCGNKKCETGENHVNCPEDCDIEKDNLCELSKCDPDCPSQKFCTYTTQVKNYLSFILIIGSVIVIIVIFIKSRKKY